MADWISRIFDWFENNRELSHEEIAAAGAWVAWQLGKVERYQIDEANANRLLLYQGGDHYVYRDDKLTVAMYTPRLTVKYLPPHANLVGFRLVEIVADYEWPEPRIAEPERMVVFRGYTVQNEQPEILFRDKWVQELRRLEALAKATHNVKTQSTNQVDYQPINRSKHE